MTQIPHDTLVVVADGGQAVLYRNTARDSEAPQLREERRLKPGQFSGQGPSGSRPGDQSIKQTAEATFIKELAQTIEHMVAQNKAEHLVVIADPTSLGEFRDAAHKSVQAVTIKTLSKDLTHESADRIAAALEKA